MGKGQNNKQSSAVKADPWKPIEPYLKEGFGDLNALYNQGAPGFFPGNTVAGMSGYSRDSLNAMADRARAGNPLMGQAGDELGKVMSGFYLDPNNNPGFQGAVNAATRPVTEAFRDVVMPGIDSNFSSAGRYGSGLQGAAYSDATNDMARQVGDISSNMAFNNYGMERGNMMNAMTMAPGFAANDYKDITALGLAGQGMEGYDQAQIDADRERYNYESTKDMQWLQNYLGLLGGPPPAGQTTTTKTPAPNPWVTAAGLGLSAVGAMPSGFWSGLGGMFGGSSLDPRITQSAYGGPR